MGKLKISETDFKAYLISNYVDEDGMKISDRKLWSSKDFFDYTGMYSVNKYTKKKAMVSTGTISYWKKKLNIKEKDIYEFHTKITRKINVSYEDWSRMYNKGYKKESSVLSGESIKLSLIKYMGLSQKYKYKTLEEIQAIVLNTWKLLGLNETEEMERFYKEWL